MSNGIHPKLPPNHIVHTICQSGATLEQLTELVPHALNPHASHVVLVAGTNNESKNVEQFNSAYQSLVRTVVSHCPRAKIICCGLFDRKDTLMTDHIQTLNATILATNCQFINNIENSENFDIHSSDGLHLNPTGKVKLSQALTAAIWSNPDKEVIKTFLQQSQKMSRSRFPNRSAGKPTSQHLPRVSPVNPPDWWMNSTGPRRSQQKRHPPGRHNPSRWNTPRPNSLRPDPPRPNPPRPDPPRPDPSRPDAPRRTTSRRNMLRPDPPRHVPLSRDPSRDEPRDETHNPPQHVQPPPPPLHVNYAAPPPSPPAYQTMYPQHRQWQHPPSNYPPWVPQHPPPPVYPARPYPAYPSYPPAPMYTSYPPYGGYLPVY